MPTPPRPEKGLRRALVLGVLALAATVVAVVPAVGGAGETLVRSAVSAWNGVFGDRPRAPVGQRMIVVLRAPSVADRVAAAAGPSSRSRMRRWATAAEASQRVLVADMQRRDVPVKSLRSFALTLNGFSAVLDARAVAELERNRGVAGVYPVRTVYPASIAGETLARPDFTAGRRPGISLHGFDGSGVKVALLDTGVDRRQPALRGSVLGGVDVLGGPGTGARAKPDEPDRLETHGTRMAGLVVGHGPIVRGVAPGAKVLPIRVVGWQQTTEGDYAVLGETDGLLAGLERAVDPNGDGDPSDAADVALAPLAEPFAAFPDGPEARAVGGATRLGTLVVAAAGNDGRAGTKGFGSVGAPGGAAEALTVGALDTRERLARAHAVLTVDGDTVVESTLSVAGAIGPRSAATLDVAGLLGPTLADPGRATAKSADGTVLADYFEPSGVSSVAGRAVLVSADGAVPDQARNAAAAGASALLVAGGTIPAGALDLDEDAAIPVVSVPGSVAAEAHAALEQGDGVTVSLVPAASAPNPAAGRVAPFSSGGLAFDGRVKPDLVARGVGLVTSDPGPGPRVATVTGSSAAAAVVAGAAALVADARPRLEATELRGVLVGSADAVEGAPTVVQGAGAVDAGAAAAARISVTPATVAYGRVTARGWHAQRGVTVRNLTTRRLDVSLGLTRDSLTPRVAFAAKPASLSLAPGESRVVTLEASAPAGTSGAAGGSFVLTPVGSRAVRLPWSVSLRPGRSAPLLSDVRLSDETFEPSAAAPAVLAFRAGRAASSAAGESVEPVALLRGRLATRQGRLLGTLFTLRDLLPGRYAFGLTGRAPDGSPLAPGAYVLTLEARPVPGDFGAKPTEVDVPFTIGAQKG